MKYLDDNFAYLVSELIAYKEMLFCNEQVLPLDEHQWLEL